MAGYSLHLACEVYEPPTLNTVSCVFDARALWQYARDSGFKPLLTPDEPMIDADTATAIEDFLVKAEGLETGDYLAITYNGHGIAASRNATDLRRGWALYDDNVITFAELFQDLARHLVNGVRVLIVSGSCQSGRVRVSEARPAPLEVPMEVASRLFAERAARLRHFRLFRGRPPGSPSIIKLNACYGDQVTLDGGKPTEHTPFVDNLLDVLAKRPPMQDFGSFIAAMQQNASRDELPNLEPIGPYDRSFFSAGPFNIVP